MVGKLETEEKRKAWKAGLDQLHETVKEIIEAQKNARWEFSQNELRFCL